MTGFRRYAVVLTVIVNINVVWKVQSLSAILSKWSPSCVTLQGVSQKYPDTFWRKLTSSVPRRTFALENVSLVFDSSGLTLLLGESSSGKSTILRLILGSERPVSGIVTLSNEDDDESSASTSINPARPVCLDTRPAYGQNEVVEDIWNKAILVPVSNKENSHLHCRILIRDLSTLLKLPRQAKIMDLSMSEVYLCRLGEACLQSMLSPAPSNKNPSTTTTTNLHGLPAPILLLDEWLDTETSVVVQKVQASLNELARNGAVVICVTHKPHLFGKNTNNDQESNKLLRCITLSRGKVLSTTA